MISCMQPLAVAVAIPHPHPPHNSDSSSGPVVQHSLIIHACAPRSHTKNSHLQQGENWKSNVSTTFYTTAHLDCFPPNVRRAQSCLMPRDLATICPSFFFRNNSPHGDCRRQEAPLDATILPWHSTAWHGIRMGEIWGCTGRLLPWFHSALW